MRLIIWKKTDLGVGKRGVTYTSANGRWTIRPNYKDSRGYSLYDGDKWVCGDPRLAVVQGRAENVEETERQDARGVPDFVWVN